MSEKKKFYITTAIAYASRKPHIGNAYDIVLADMIARYKKMMGFDVFLQTGSDEHGQKIEEYAKAEGISPQEYVDKIAAQIKEVWNSLNTDYDKFIRTTDKDHEKVIQKIFKKLYDQGDIYKGHYEGKYCVPCESFFTASQLVDGKCPDCGRDVIDSKEEAYFLKLSKYQDRLLEYYEQNPDFIKPESRKNEMINNFLKPGLSDLCISRSSFKWGIPVPFDEKHVIYVWLDALTNYITALGYDVDKQGENFGKYWPADLHVIGKDILRFHTIYWPIFLMALDLPLPKKVFGHPWLLFGEDKMSKSKGNVIYADDLVHAFGVDAVRHYVLSETPFAADGSITYETVIERYNSDLANNLGNLVSRTLAMTKKYFGGTVPAPAQSTEFDASLIETVRQTVETYKAKMDDLHIADAEDAVFAMLRRANKYIDETAPWVLAKDESKKEVLGTVLYNLLETIRVGAVLLTPFMPSTAASIFKQLNTEEGDLSTVENFGVYAAGTVLGESEMLFGRIDAEKKLEELKAEHEAAVKAAQKPEKPEGVAEIGIDDFMGVELRTAQVIACEPVPKAKKLLKLQIDLGYEQRQVVSGIAKWYKPEDLVGKKIIVVANLKPAKLCGVESQGMILASGEETVRVVFLAEDTPLGERVR